MHLQGSNKIWSQLRHLGMVDAQDRTAPKFSNDTLNQYYLSVQSSDPDIDIPPIVNHSVVSKFSFSPITPAEFHKALNSFSSSSVGADGVSLKVLQLCTPVLVSVFTSIFNNSLTSTTYPKRKITPLLLQTIGQLRFYVLFIKFLKKL